MTFITVKISIVYYNYENIIIKIWKEFGPKYAFWIQQYPFFKYLLI